MTTIERNQVIAARRRNGESCAKIARDMDMDPKVVSRLAVSMGIRTKHEEITETAKEYLRHCSELQRAEGIIQAAKLREVTKKSPASLSHILARLTASGLLTRHGDTPYCHWKLTEKGAGMVEETPKLTLRVLPELLAQRLTKDFRRTVLEDSPVEAVLPQSNEPYESFVDSLIALVKVYVEGKCVKG